jgi:hypothetical protein
MFTAMPKFYCNSELTKNVQDFVGKEERDHLEDRGVDGKI